MGGVLKSTNLSESNVKRTSDRPTNQLFVMKGGVLKFSKVSKSNVDWLASRGQHLRRATGRQREAPALPGEERVSQPVANLTRSVRPEQFQLRPRRVVSTLAKSCRSSGDKAASPA